MHSAKNSRPLAVFLACLIALFLSAPARAADSALPASDHVDIMPSSEVASGMKGQGLTSFKGYGLQKFDFEVLGKMAGWWPKGDLILIRMSGPVVDEAGIIAGMSGSPCYIGGRLIGAVAYGWTSCKIPLAGVTPAEQMMQVGSIEDQSSDDGRLAARRTYQARAKRLAEFVSHGPESWDQVRPFAQAALRLGAPRPAWAGARSFDRESLPASVRDLLPAGASQGLAPLPIPLSIGGPAAAGGLTSLAPLMAGTGFIPVQAGGAGSAQTAAAGEFVPGVSVGCAFVTGDVDISGMGTLTWADGEKALAFGHPMFGSGQTDLPLVLGDVQAVVPSLDRSFKLAAAGRVVGRITQDRESAILARIGEDPPMFPCTVRVRGAVNETYHYQVAGYWESAAKFAYYALYLSSSRWEGSGNRYTVTAHARIKMKGLDKPFEFENIYNSYSVTGPGADLVQSPMESLLLNPFRKLEVESLDYDVDVKRGFSAALIESVWLDRARVRPGEEVNAYVRLRKFRGDEAVQKITVRIPETAEPGSQVQVIVCDASTNRTIKRGLDPGFASPTSFESFEALVREMEPNTRLVLRASVADQGLRYDGAAMPSLPPSAISIIQQNERAGQSTPLVKDVVQSVDTPWVLEGAKSAVLTVEEPDYSK